MSNPIEDALEHPAQTIAETKAALTLLGRVFTEAGTLFTDLARGDLVGAMNQGHALGQILGPISAASNAAVAAALAQEVKTGK